MSRLAKFSRLKDFFAQSAVGAETEDTGSGSDNNDVSPVSRVSRRLSAAARRQARKLGSLNVGPTIAPPNRAKPSYVSRDALFDWSTRATQSSNFFMSSGGGESAGWLGGGEDDSTAAASNPLREAHLSLRTGATTPMEQCRFDLIPDDERDQRKITHIRKWNAIRKKYVMTPVDAGGKALGVKQQKKRNEAGVMVRSELTDTGRYKKWKAASRKRIQKAGEMEAPSSYVSPAARRESRGGTREQTGDTGSSDPLPGLDSMTKDPGLLDVIRKGVVPTAKQRKKLLKLQRLQKGETAKASSKTKSEVKGVRELMKTKKDLRKNKARDNPQLRKKMHQIEKKRHMAKRARQNVEKAAPKRSFVLRRTKGQRRGR